MKKVVKLNKRVRGYLLCMAVIFLAGILYCADFSQINNAGDDSKQGSFTVSTNIERDKKTYSEQKQNSEPVDESVVDESLLQSGEFAVKGSENLLSGAPEQLQNSADNIIANNRININTADKTALMTLPGIGEAKAERIIAYRNEHGLFYDTADIMRVSGIKSAAYEKIKDKICTE